MYRALVDCYEKDDTVYLFGFSRGAFTVRALAGLVHRCGLAPKNTAWFGLRFWEMWWRRYRPMKFDRDEMRRWREARGHRSCSIHFVGVWDTVKSYGGLRPILVSVHDSVEDLPFGRKVHVVSTYVPQEDCVTCPGR